MKLLVLCVLVVIGPNCFQEMILTQTLQVLRLSQQGGRGSCRSSRSSQPVASARSGEFPSMLSDPSSRMAAAAWSDLEELEGGRFRRVPRKRGMVFLTMCTVQICTVCNIYLFWKVCEFRVNVRFLLYELTLDGFRMQ